MTGLSSSTFPRSPDLTQPLLEDESTTPNRWQLPADGRAATAFKVGTAMFSFAIGGVFVSTLGVILPFVQRFYGLSDTAVSLIFLAGPAGYVMAARLNHIIHVKLGQRGVAAIGPIVQLLSAVITAAHPPYPALLFALALGGFGFGLLDGSWCAWAGAMDRANLVSGLLHGSFSAGAGFGPILAAQLLELEGYQWYHWYFIIACVLPAEVIILPFAFRHEGAERYRQYEQRQSGRKSTEKAASIFTYRATWICAAYLLIEVGTESAISGWIVSFMMRVRDASPSISSLCESGFWGGMAIGRVVLGGVTDKIGLKYGIIIYLACAMMLQALFILVNGWAVSIILVTLIGFFAGPFFPASIVQLTRLLPLGLHVAAVSYVASIGQVGGALLPFALGALSHWLGLQVFGIMIVVQLAVCLLLWILFTGIQPGAPTQNLDGENDEEHIE